MRFKFTGQWLGALIMDFGIRCKGLLYISKGSCAELRTQIYISMETGLLNKKTAHSLLEATKKISAMLQKLIKVRIQNF